MNVVRLKFDHLPDSLPASACCIGYFDGFHRGHQELVRRTVETARQKNLVPGLITFDPDPWVLFAPASNLSHIMSMEDKIHMAGKLGIQAFYILEFSFAFAALSTDQFHEVLERMHVKELICGFDFHYGTGNSGSPGTLQAQQKFGVQIVDSVQDEDGKISSTRIEACLKEGRVEEAAWLLGQYYSVQGTIVHGYRRGTSLLEMPTANLKCSDHYVLPKEGVYFGYVLVKKEMFPAMINIGSNPTFRNDRISIEAHLFDFDQDIYGESCRFYFCRHLRDGKKFENFQALKAQLLHDQAVCRTLIRPRDALLVSTERFL